MPSSAPTARASRTLINILSGEIPAVGRPGRVAGAGRHGLVAAPARARRPGPQLPAQHHLPRLQRAGELPPGRAGARTPRPWAWWQSAAALRGQHGRRARGRAAAGLADQLDRTAGLLSHGQKRQLEIAMCLATAPQVLLLDEPLAGMGAEETDRMLALLADLKAGHAILLVEHDMDAVFRIADRITVMVNGAVIASGTPDAVRTGPAGPDHPRGLRWRRPQLRQLRPDRTRGRACGLGLPQHDERAVVAGDGADQRVRQRGHQAEVPAQAGHRRVDRLLRPDRAQPRLRPRQHDHARQEGRRRLCADRQQDVDQQQPDRRRLRGLGQGRRRADPGLRAREGLEGTVRARHPRQGGPARQHHRRDRDGQRLLPRGERLPRGARPQGPLHLPEQRALRHRLGRPGRGRGLLPPRAPVHAGPHPVRPTAGQPTSWSRRSWPTC
jgi:branched-chain amino acid transport system ATP-binding protein